MPPIVAACAVCLIVALVIVSVLIVSAEPEEDRRIEPQDSSKRREIARFIIEECLGCSIFGFGIVNGVVIAASHALVFGVVPAMIVLTASPAVGFMIGIVLAAIALKWHYPRVRIKSLRKTTTILVISAYLAVSMIAISFDTFLRYGLLPPEMVISIVIAFIIANRITTQYRNLSRAE